MKNDREENVVKTMRVEEAAKKLGWSAEFLRALARRGSLPFAFAARKSESAKQWTYKINEAALEKFIRGDFIVQLTDIPKQ